MESTAPVFDFPDTTWDAGGPTRNVENRVEDGAVLRFPRLAFALTEGELRFLDPKWADGRAKNISLRWRPDNAPAGTAAATETRPDMRGAGGTPADLQALESLMARFADASHAFALRLFPHYRGHLRRGNTSFRPTEVAGRRTSWRQDDTRLHVDAFPSNPMHGTRLLRVFTNVNPHGAPRHWRVGEPFEAHAGQFLASVRPPLPGSAWLLAATGITKRRRSEYDHVMLQLHDRAKADLNFQRTSPQASVDFVAGSTWVVFSDQVPHAVLGGQHLLEQTLLLDEQHQRHPERSPRSTLARLLGRALD